MNIVRQMNFSFIMIFSGMKSIKILLPLHLKKKESCGCCVEDSSYS